MEMATSRLEEQSHPKIVKPIAPSIKPSSSPPPPAKTNIKE
jgi:hypothetical protein